jgi:hypothetical protein
MEEARGFPAQDKDTATEIRVDTGPASDRMRIERPQIPAAKSSSAVSLFINPKGKSYFIS